MANIKKVQSVSATLSFKETFTDTIQQMIDDGELKTKKDIRDYVKECLIEDILNKC